MVIFHSPDGTAGIVYDTSAFAKYHDRLFEVDAIPEGSGILMTDGATLWWEPVPQPEPEPVDELGQLKETVTALQGENAALQEAVDLLTLAILEG